MVAASSRFRSVCKEDFGIITSRGDSREDKNCDEIWNEDFITVRKGVETRIKRFYSSVTTFKISRQSIILKTSKVVFHRPIFFLTWLLKGSFKPVYL